MRKSSGLLIAALFVLGLAALIAPASGQTLEATPEVTADTGRLAMVLHADGNCFFTPDEMAVAVPNAGVYDLPDGTLRFALPTVPGLKSPYINFTADGSRMFVQGDAVYEISTGREVMNLIGFGLGSANDRWLATPMGIYSVQTGEKVYDMRRERLRGRILDMWVPPDGDLVIVRFDNPDGGSVLIDIPTGEVVQDVGRRGFFNRDATRMAVIGDALYTVGVETALAPLPAGDYTPLFSGDGRWLALYDHTEALVYDAETGAFIVRIGIVPDLRSASISWTDAGLLHVFGDELIRTPEGGFVDEVTHNWAYDIPGGGLLFQHDGQLTYFGGARRAWLEPSLGLFDPVTSEILLPRPVSPFLTRNGRVVRINDGEYDLDTLELLYKYPPEFTGTVVFDDAYSLAAVKGQGLYDVRTGELLVRASDIVNVTRDGRYAITGRAARCTVYRVLD